MSKRTGTEMVPKYQTLSTTCDNCGRTEKGEPDDWFEFRSSHNDWGNDSIESSESFDACSGECFLTLLRQAVDGYDRTFGEPTLSIWVSEHLTYRSAKSLLEAASSPTGEARND